MICEITAQSPAVRPGARTSFRVELCPGTATDGLTLEVQGEAKEWATVEPVKVEVRETFWKGKQDLFPVPFFDIRFQIPPSWNPPIGLTFFGINVFWRTRPEAATLGRGALLLEGYCLTTEAFEWRMRPGRSSQAGFLGWKERLDDVMDRDDRTVKQLDLTYEGLATALEKLLEARHRALCEVLALPVDQDGGGKPETIAADPRFAVGLTYCLGTQACPWSADWTNACEAGPPRAGSRWSSIDWRIRNLRTGQEMRGPGMAVHLIREHHFFEGLATPYRVDPLELAQLLELGSKA